MMSIKLIVASLSSSVMVRLRVAGMSPYFYMTWATPDVLHTAYRTIINTSTWMQALLRSSICKNALLWNHTRVDFAREHYSIS
jgi:hypothetical protein